MTLSGLGAITIEINVFMSIISNLNKQLTEILKEGELQKVTSEVIEAVADSDLSDSILKELPIVSTITGMYKAAISIQDKLFTKKLLYFLKELQSVPQEQRLRQVIQIEDSKDYRTKVGEKLLHIIDKCDDLDKAEMSGRMFKAYLEGGITYAGFLICINCIEKVSIPVLRSFIKRDKIYIEADKGSDYLAAGLMELYIKPPKIKVGPNRASFDDELKYEITDFNILCTDSEAGTLIKNYLS